MIVTDPGQLTAAWFTQALGRTVTAVELTPVNIGAMCRMYRCALTADGDGPASVIVKFATDDPGTLGLAQAMGMYELEVHSYRELLPLLSDVSVPACHFAELDAASGAFTLVLEDLTGVTRAGDVLTESTREECSAVLAQLAALQAGSWNTEATRALGWLADPARTVAVFDSMPAGLEPFVARFGHALEPAHVALFERVIPQAGAWIRSWDGPTVVQHGDLRTDNILFRADGTATLIDFQTVRLGPAGIDPAYFLGSSLSTPTRRATEHELIGELHERLGVPGVSFEQYFDAYRAGALYAVYLFCGLSAQVAPSERIDRVIADQTRRYADMAIDLDAVALSPAMSS